MPKKAQLTPLHLVPYLGRRNMKHGELMLAGRAASAVHGTTDLSGVQNTGPPFSSQPAEPGMASCLCSGMGGWLPIDHPDGGIQLKSNFPARAGASAGTKHSLALWGPCSSSPTGAAQPCPCHGMLNSFPAPDGQSFCPLLTQGSHILQGSQDQATVP